MDLLPINPTSTNKVDASINLANDGGSKSNTGFLNTRGSAEEEKHHESVDEVEFSNSHKEEEIEEENIDFAKIFKDFIAKIKRFISKIFKNNEEEDYNIYKKHL